MIQFAEEMLRTEPENRFVRYLLGKGHYENQSWALAADAWRPHYGNPDGAGYGPIYIHRARYATLGRIW